MSLTPRLKPTLQPRGPIGPSRYPGSRRASYTNVAGR